MMAQTMNLDRGMKKTVNSFKTLKSLLHIFLKDHSPSDKGFIATQLMVFLLVTCLHMIQIWKQIIKLVLNA